MTQFMVQSPFGIAVRLSFWFLFLYQLPEMSMAHQLSVTQWKVEENGLLPEIVPVSQKRFLCQSNHNLMKMASCFLSLTIYSECHHGIMTCFMIITSYVTCPCPWINIFIFYIQVSLCIFINKKMYMQFKKFIHGYN